MIPKILQTYEQKIPLELNYWFLKENDQIRLLSDAIKNPEIRIDKELKIKGEWIYSKDHHIVRRSEDKEEIIYSNNNAISFIYLDDHLYPIERRGKNIFFNGEKYTSFQHKFSFSLLENKNRILVFTNNKVIELEKPVRYRINPSYVNLVYDNYSIIIDLDGNKSSYKRPDFYLGTSSKGKIFQTLSGKIVTEGEYELLGVCTSDAYYLGEASIGLVIICNNKLKYYYKGGWAYLSNVSTLTANYVNYNYIITTDVLTSVYDGNLKKLFDLNNILTVIADRKYIYIVSNSRKIYIIEPSDDYFPIDVIQDSQGIIIAVDKRAQGVIKLGKGLIKVDETNNEEKDIIRVEPSRLLVSTQSKIEVSNELFTYYKDISIPPLNSELNLIEGYILVTKGGRVKNINDYYNAILKARIKYSIPTRLASVIKLKILGKEYSLTLNNSKGEISIAIPIVKFNSNEELVLLSLERNGSIEASKEYVIKVKEIKENKDYKRIERIENVSKKIISRTEDEYFEWVKLEEYQSVYDNVIIAKEGDIVNIEGEKFEVKAGVQKVTIQKDNFSREYFIYGISSPIKGIKALIQADKLILKVDLKYALPITVIYGTQIKTSSNGEFIFNLDPAYSTIIMKTYYSENIKWEYKYELAKLIENTITEAEIVSNTLKEQLAIYGIL